MMGVRELTRSVISSVFNSELPALNLFPDIYHMTCEGLPESRILAFYYCKLLCVHSLLMAVISPLISGREETYLIFHSNLHSIILEFPCLYCTLSLYERFWFIVA